MILVTINTLFNNLEEERKKTNATNICNDLLNSKIKPYNVDLTKGGSWFKLTSNDGKTNDRKKPVKILVKRAGDIDPKDFILTP